MAKEDVMKLLACKVSYDSRGNEKSKTVFQTVKNFELAMENDERIAGKIKYDEFSRQIHLGDSVPWSMDGNRAWGSNDDSELFAILQADYGLKNRNDYFDAIRNVSMRNKFHPVRDFLDSLEWEGKPAIRSLLPDYLGVEDTEYNYQAMRLWMLEAIERVRSPGCKADYSITFVGAQGIGKSTMLRQLALKDEWFNDSLDSLDTDKAAQSLLGSWIIELAELKSLARTAGGVDDIVQFLNLSKPS